MAVADPRGESTEQQGVKGWGVLPQRLRDNPGEPGTGLSALTLIPTPDYPEWGGWIELGRLRVGDRVYGADGKICRVTWVEEPVRVESGVRLGLGNAAKRTLLPDEWCVEDNGWLNGHADARLVTINYRASENGQAGGYRDEELLEKWWTLTAKAGVTSVRAVSLQQVKDTQWKVRRKNGRDVNPDHGFLAGAVLEGAWSRLDLPIDPYLMGMIIRQWKKHKKFLSVMKHALPEAERQLIKAGVEYEVIKDGKTPWTVCRIRIPSVEPLLEGHRFHQGFPMAGWYLRADAQSRRELLSGMLDDWERVAKHYRVVNGVPGKRLPILQRGRVIIWRRTWYRMVQCAELVRSLGGRATTHWDNPKRFMEPTRDITGRPTSERRFKLSGAVRWHIEVAAGRLMRNEIRHDIWGMRQAPLAQRAAWRVLVAEQQEQQICRRIAVDSPTGMYLASWLMVPVPSESFDEATGAVEKTMAMWEGSSRARAIPVRDNPKPYVGFRPSLAGGLRKLTEMQHN